VELNCRECTWRESCIQESQQAPGVKRMIRQTFDEGRDTQELWKELHKECLLLAQAEEARRRRPSLLSQRLKGDTGPGDEAETAVDEPGPGLNGAAKGHTSATLSSSPVSKPAPGPVYVHSETVEEEEEEEEAPEPVHYCLAREDGQYRIALPVDGTILLGRFDLKSGVIPDVDLSPYDTSEHLISRRHARIVGHGGLHFIEDLGSTNGTGFNGARLRVGQKIPLQPGDRINFGQTEFVYVPAPRMQASADDEAPRAHLRVASTGNRFSLPSQGEVIVGRSDYTKNIIADIDLSEEGDVSLVVTRRHVKIIARQGQHFVEDLGSTNSTKLNGAIIENSELGPLNPGDHLWLGGCVLVYGVEPQLEPELA
jgi:pSer/pThr/pTyr-binding forkhead associated (FHA) protein